MTTTTIYIYILFFFLLSLDDRIVSYLVRWVHLRTLILLSSGSLPINHPHMLHLHPHSLPPTQSLIDSALFFLTGYLQSID